MLPVTTVLRARHRTRDTSKRTHPMKSLTSLFSCCRIVLFASAASLGGIAVAQVPLQDQQPAGSALRPAVMGPLAAVSTGDPLTTVAALRVLLKGGNAFDAGVAALIAGGVLEQDLYSLGGEALVLVYPKQDAKVTSIVGQGWAPRGVDVDWYLARRKTL